MTTRRQHYVWRHYLAEWQNDSPQVSVLMNERLFRSNPSNIMVERDFYSLQLKAPNDGKYLRMFLMSSRTPPDLRRSHDRFIAICEKCSYANALIQSNPSIPATEKKIAQDIAIEFEEKLHCQIERDATPILQSLRTQDRRVINSEETAMPFFNFIAHQYLRTKVLRDSIQNGLSEFIPQDVAQRIRNVYCHCIASNLGASLYRDRSTFELIFVHASSPTEFITGDQPIVNILGTFDERETHELALYYPLSPTLGTILAPKSLNMAANVLRSSNVTTAWLNDLIARVSKRYLVASSDETLVQYAPQPDSLMC